MTHLLRQLRNFTAWSALALVFGVLVFYAWIMLAATALNWVHAAPPSFPVAEQVREIVEAPPLPTSHLLAVPYTSQAPKRQWKIDTFENGCEETSLMMMDAYWQKTTIDAESATRDIQMMVDWQRTNWGKHKDLTVWELADFATYYYGPRYQSRVFVDPTTKELQKELAAGRPVIVPAMSHALKNPGFGPTSVYHMLILVGYDETGFIAHDPGVNPGQGKNYHYAYDVLHGAIDAQADHLAGQGSVALVFSPQ